MHWTDWSDFWHMGGYGLYVWSAYGTTAFLLLGELVLLRIGASAQARRATALGSGKGVSR